MKKIIALIMIVVALFSIMSISVYAEDESQNTVTVTVNETEFVFDANTSEEFRNNFITYYFSDNDEDAVAYGLMCTLFGHKLESAVIQTVTHKVRATDPRCLRETYDTDACTRCDYTNAVMIDTSYISCCK